MSVELEVGIKAKVDEASLAEAVQKTSDSYKGAFDDISKTWDKSWSTMIDKSGKSISSGIGQSLIDGVTSGFDNISGVWDSAWTSLAKSAKSILADGLGSLALGSLGFASGGKGLTEAISDSIAAYKMGDSFTEALAASGLVKEGSLTSSVLGWFSGSSAATSTAGVSGIASMSAADYSAAMAAEMGYDMAAGASAEAAGAGLSLGTGLLAGGGVLAAGELMALATGGVGPLGAMGQVLGLSDSGGHNQATALAAVNADMDYLGQATQLVRQALEQATTNAQGFATTVMQDMSQASLEMARLAERAGLSNDQLNAMVNALDPFQAKLVEASEVVGLTGEKIDLMSQTFLHDAESIAESTGAGEAFQASLLSMAEAMALPQAQSQSLGAAIQSLVANYEAGSISTQTLSDGLKTAFAEALQSTAADAATTTEQMRALAESIASIPTSWDSTINVHYNYDAAPGTSNLVYHAGGLVMHQGGWLDGLPRYHQGARVSPLASDEIPLIAQRGEYIVRADSVNASTLPLLNALNASGRAGRRAAASPPQVNLHLEIHGSLLGDNDSLEELTRQIQGKLRDLDNSRYTT
jgi:hypothetical protein